MSTDNGSQPQPPDFVSTPQKSDATSPEARRSTLLASNIASLETKLDAEREERREERFRWVCAVVVLFNVVAIDAIEGSLLFVPIFMLQIIALMGYARHLGVDWAVTLMGELFSWMQRTKGE